MPSSSSSGYGWRLSTAGGREVSRRGPAGRGAGFLLHEGDYARRGGLRPPLGGQRDHLHPRGNLVKVGEVLDLEGDVGQDRPVHAHPTREDLTCCRVVRALLLLGEIVAEDGRTSSH